MKMLDRAVAAIQRDPATEWTLTAIRNAAGVKLRAGYRLAQQLQDDSRVAHVGGNRFVAGVRE